MRSVRFIYGSGFPFRSTIEAVYDVFFRRYNGPFTNQKSPHGGVTILLVQGMSRRFENFLLSPAQNFL